MSNKISKRSAQIIIQTQEISFNETNEWNEHNKKNWGLFGFAISNHTVQIQTEWRGSFSNFDGCDGTGPYSYFSFTLNLI